MESKLDFQFYCCIITQSLLKTSPEEMVLKCFIAFCVPQQQSCQKSLLCRRMLILFIKSPGQPDLTWLSFDQGGLLLIAEIPFNFSYLKILQILHLYMSVFMFICVQYFTDVFIYTFKKSINSDIVFCRCQTSHQEKGEIFQFLLRQAVFLAVGAWERYQMSFQD